MTPSTLAWRAFGSRAPEGKTGGLYKFEAARGECVTCAAPLTEGVPFTPRRGVAGIDNATFSGYADYARWGTHVCPACAWLYGDPKRMHRAMLCIGDEGWWPTIAQDIEGRPRWRRALGELAKHSPDTPMCGVLTTDPKPRLWPRMQMASCGAPGLYLHIPEQDISRWSRFSLRAVAECLRLTDEALKIGATKTAVLRGLWGNPKLIDKVGIAAIERLESLLAPRRGSIEFSIAAVIA